MAIHGTTLKAWDSIGMIIYSYLNRPENQLGSKLRKDCRGWAETIFI